MDSARLFSRIYSTDAWNGGSGPGSTPEFCRPLVDWLSEYVNENGVRSLVDFGCGDFQWMPQVLDRTGVEYLGLDVVPSLIAVHGQRHPRWRFAVLDAATADAAALPAADLYWAKDVLQHWPDHAITSFLDRLFAARPRARLLVCNCTGQARGPRTLDSRWHFAPLDGERHPLAAYSPEHLFAWDRKKVYRLHQRSA